MRYPITVTHDSNETWLVSFVDLPAHSCGDDIDEALLNAEQALEIAIEDLIERRQAVPMPSAILNERDSVALAAQISVKVLLHNEMIAQGVRKSDLAKRLHVHMPQVDRLLKTGHASRLDAIESAFTALGKKLEFRIT